MRPPLPTVWRLSVPHGKYNFYADFKANQFKAKSLLNEVVRPPYWGKPLKVES
jgi:hypothetical protein